MAISFNNSNLSSPVYNVYNVNEFDGVDYTTTPTNVAETRAVDMSNYLPEGQGIIKRKGLENFNNSLSSNEANEKVINLAKFKNFYIKFSKIPVQDQTYKKLSIKYYNNNQWVELLSNIQSYRNPYDYVSLYEYENKLFFITGYVTIDFLGEVYKNGLYGYINIDNDTKLPVVSIIVNGYNFSNGYIPTTAIQIPYQDYLGNKFKNDIATTFEAFNILSRYCYMKNSFVATKENAYETTQNSETYYRWYLKYDFSSLGNFRGVENVEYKFSPTISNYIVNYSSYTPLDDYDTSPNNYFNIEFLVKKSLFDNLSTPLTIDMTFLVSLASKPTLFYGFNRFEVYDGKLWFYGSEKYPNTDLHTETALYADDRSKDFLYIPDTSYQAFGSSASKIIGYGTLPNGNQMVIKEFYNSEPNVFIRTKNTATSTNEYGMPEVKITYPITQSGVSMNMKGYDNVIQFGNYALINAPKGIYTINIGTSTATQTYEMIEMSYFIRNDLGDDLTGSWYIVKDNFLYLSRFNKDNKRRVYVADVNRMSLVEGHYQFEWWVLDNMNYDKVDMIDDELVFSNEYGSFKFSEDFVDKIVHEDYLTFVNDGVNTSKFISTEMQYTGKTNLVVDSNRNDNKLIILNSDSVIYTQIKLNNDYAYIKDFYANFRKNFKITPMYYIPIGRTQSVGNLDNLQLAEDNEILEYILQNENQFSSQLKTITVASMNNSITTYYKYYYYLNDSEHKVVSIKPNKLYCYVNGQYYDYDDCVLEGEKWFYLNDMVELGDIDEVIFNSFDMKLCFEGYEENVCDLDSLSSLSVSSLGFTANDFFEYIKNTTQNNNKIVFEYLEPVKSYWYSKHNCLGDISTLKTMTNMYFVPEVRHGGETYVGYRTCKRENQYFTNAKGESFDFNDIDFDDFTFGEREFGRTYSSKKKIKNFSFIQLKIYSNDKYDSSASMLSFKYRYSKNNKGVK